MPTRAFATRPGHVAPFARRRPVPTARRASENDVENLPLPEGSLGLPLVGETLSLVANPDDFGVSRYMKFGNVWKTNILGSNTVMVYGEKNVLSVLRREDVLVESKWPDVTKTLVGPKSLNLLKGQEHDRIKDLMASAFTKDAMRGYIPTMERIFDSFLTEWVETLEKPFSSVEWGTYMASALFGSCLLGLEGDLATARRVQAMFDALAKGFQVVPVDLPFTAYGKAVEARKSLLKEVEASVRKIKSGESCGSGLEFMMDARDGNGKGLTTDELEDAVLAMVYGNASMGPTCAKILQYVGNPKVLDKLRQEQIEVVASKGSALCLEALDSMKYCTAVVQEILRITPIVPVAVKQAKITFELEGFKVPAGWQVFCHVGDSATKYNADEFLPERWLPEKGASACPFQNSGGYSLPFVVGPRACLGQPFVMTALQIFLAVLVRGYDWRMMNPDEEWGIFPVPRPKEGLLVSSFEKRR
ncbi:hypothetical protein BSKO_05032 [Bryopsis sp. KO-2023]|nr:hypothetical protein BSKO_05032 [Bryopsis sp. KO-2023]